MKLLLLGKTGQVGWELQRGLSPIGQLVSLGRADLDLQDVDAVRACVRAHAPDVLVNAAAYTGVDRAESERETARRINAHAVEAMAREMQAVGGILIHYSTDYVFDGRKSSAYVEEDIVAPLSVYGQSKALGEQAIRDSGVRHLILRTSWIYGRHGTNFARSILRLARERDSLRVVDDQFGAPTGAELVADVTVLMLHVLLREAGAASLLGTYHLSAAGRTSWHGYAMEVLRLAHARGMVLRARPEAVEAIDSITYGSPAARPANSVLDCRKLERSFALRLPEWTEPLGRFVDEMAELERA